MKKLFSILIFFTSICFTIDAQIHDTGNNVGIGVTTPQAKLHVNGDIRLDDVISLRGEQPHLFFAKSNGNGVINFGNTDNGQGTLYFRSLNQINDLQNTNDLMVIKHNGSVGIGVNNPHEKLHVNGDIRLDGVISLRGEQPHLFFAKSNGNGVINFGNTDNGQGTLYFRSLNQINDLQNANDLMVIRHNGSVGIGISNPAPHYKLFVDGWLGIRHQLVFEHQDGHGFINFGNAQNTGALVFRSLNPTDLSFVDLMQITQDGRVAIGCYTSPPTGYKLAVNGGIRAKHVRIDIDNWCDYVFDDTYHLKPLEEVEKYIKENKHLEEIPTTEQVKEEGIDLGEMNALLLKKVEEITLYLIEMNNQNEELKKRLETLEKK